MSIEFFKAGDFAEFLSGPYAAEVANSLLKERGTAVYSGGIVTNWDKNKTSMDTHQALLINITPLKQESPERALLREFLALADEQPETRVQAIERLERSNDVRLRAKKLLEGE